MKLFFCHPSNLKPILDTITQRLPKFLKPWVDEEKLCWGDKLFEQISQNIQSSDFLIILLDKGALDSKWVQRELQLAHKHEETLDRSFILPCLIGKQTGDNTPPSLKGRLHLECSSFDSQDIEALAQKISDSLFHLLVKQQKKNDNLGDIAGNTLTNCFSGNTTSDCHSKIFKSKHNLQNILNFTSIVNNSTYNHPTTVKIGKQTATPEDVKASFRALHPEFSESGSGWDDAKKTQAILSSLPPRFRIQHGPRMFTVPRGREGTHSLMRATLDRLKEHPSRAYLSLQQPEADLYEGASEPAPGLVGIQFTITAQNKLNLIAQFRNIELSFWWAVNMYEMGMILNWAFEELGNLVKSKGVIILQSSVASWKEDARAVFNSELDSVTFGELLELAMKINGNDDQSKKQLAELILKKSEQTSVYNIDTTGLDRLSDILEGVAHINKTNDKKRVSTPITEVSIQLKNTLSLLRSARLEPDSATQSRSVKKAQAALRKASDSLNDRV